MALRILTTKLNSEMVMANFNLRVLLVISVAGVLALSCNKTSGKIESNKNGNQADRFLQLFPTITFQNLHIYSPFDKPDGDKFKGTKIDTTYHEYFSKDEWLYNAIQTGSEVFSCYKFALNDSITGLIVRIPSQYQESRIALCLWDNRNQAIWKQIVLADAFGDGMWYFVQDAWMTDVNNDGSFDI